MASQTRRKTGWKQKWKAFAAQEPGRRFRDRYEQHQGSGEARTWWRKPLNLGGGIALLAIGAFLTIAPGPAVVFFVLGGFMLANESRVAAGMFDWIDVKIAPLREWMGRRWRKLSPTTRRVSKVCMISGSVLAMVAGFWLMR